LKGIAKACILKDEVNEMNLKILFIETALMIQKPELLVVAVQLPSGAKEVITNTSDLKNKINYYIEKYDDDFCLKVAPDVKIVGFILL
jgi:hypothetical protein